MAGPESALTILLPDVDALVQPIRDRHDPAVAKGWPAHVTALFPFLPPDDITPETLVAAREVVASTAPFDLVFQQVDEFPGVIWLRPEPDQPIRALTKRLWDVYPQCPPYGGEFTDSQPHCTLAHVTANEQVTVRKKIDAALDGILPITVHIAAIRLWTTDDGVNWSEHAVLSMGG